CAKDCLVEAAAAIAASATVIARLRFIITASIKSSGAAGSTAQSIAQRARRDRSTSCYELPQRDDEIGAFAGFAALVDAVIGHHDRAAGGQDLRDPGHRFGRDGEAVERLGGAVRRSQRLDLGSGHLAAPGG